MEQYREIGTPDECRAAVDKQRAKKPKKTESAGYRYTDTYRCPNCGGNFSGTGIANYCYRCGQKLNWKQLAIKKTQNLTADKKQYNDYVSRLGKDYLLSNVSDFQDIKYGNSKEYGILKAQYRGMSYYENAVSNEPLITSSVKAVAKSAKLDSYGMEHRLKTKDSYLRKIRTEYKQDGNTYEVKDIIRYTLGTENPNNLVEKMNAAIAGFSEMGYNTVTLKNTWNNPKNPYKGINTIVVAPNGQKFEVQYHTKESFDTKEKMHKLYEDWRSMEDKASEPAVKLSMEMARISKELEIPRNIEKVKQYGRNGNILLH